MADSLDDLPQPDYEGTAAVEELETDGDNPNEMTDEQFGLLCDRMRQNGWLGGPIITDTDGLIADGEHRWRAAREIGLDEVPVRQFDIDDATRRLWRQELNKIHGEHDSKRDALEYDHLLGEGYTEEVEALTDAADEDLDELLAELRMEGGQSPAYEYDPDHSVYFEDCVEGMRERLDDDSVDCVIMDPPYGIDFQSEWGSDFDKIESDGDLEESLELYGNVCSELSRVLKPSGHVYTFTRWDVYPEFYRESEKHFDPRNCLVWHKPKGGTGDVRNYVPNHEMIMFSALDNPRPLLNGEGRPKNVIRMNPDPPEEYAHPTQKPIELIGQLMTNSTNTGDTVLDPFMGSGTTAVAAIQNGRDYVGFELDADNYRDVIERRIGEAKRQVEAGVNSDE